ncbi:MAG: hypothetical protein GDA49_09025 [Rhodospirillales bacterium]|nr:hypothetical protein [Rhodospirillales bacterium]
MADSNTTDDERRKAEVARLRAAERSTTPEAYNVKSKPQVTVDPMSGAGDSYGTLFGSCFAGSTSWRQHLATAMQLGTYGLAHIALILNVAQCEWWYEPGMYGGPPEYGSSR